MRAWRKASSAWPGRLDAGRRTTNPRRSRLRRPAATRSRPRSRSTGSSQKTRPTTAARCSTRLSAVGRASMRAASSAWRLSGSAPAPGPARCRTSSSRNSGLPSALARTSSPSSAGSRPVGVRLASSSRLWPSVSGRREMEARSSPAWRPKPGWVSASSGRVVATTSRGPEARATVSSRVSSSSGPAQWRSSTTSSAGPAAAQAVANRGQARASSSATAFGSSRSSGLPGRGTPQVAASANTVASSSAGPTRPRMSRRPEEHLAWVVSSGSASEMPQASRSISPRAQ